MKAQYYDAIFRRKSFHLFRNVGAERLTAEELQGIEEAFRGFEPAVPGIRTALRIVSSEEISFKKDAEYCALIYSEKKDNWLLNAGYIGQQLDLYLTEHNIGSLWFGLGKPDERVFDGLDYVIMFAIRKVDSPEKFRRDMKKSKRLPLGETWWGDMLPAAEIARFSPSACNSQPWRAEHRDGVITVWRHRKPGMVGIMPPAAVSYFNRIDMGIYLCILEICLEKQGIPFERTLFTDDGGEREMTKTAEYRLG